ncbi:unnamed protein product [Linum trigynum]|uniref:F-box domain-containing protein n=1 Tax=Linum trigynum TaxID=586398 RepID=A0AAV2EF78_9ROSI
MSIFEAEQGRKRRRNNLGMATPVVGGEEEEATTDQFSKLPDELAVGILSRSATTMNEAARCSSLLGKRWRNMWQLIDSAVLDFNKSDDDDRRSEPQRRRFVDRVDQAIGLIRQSKTRLDELKIVFKFTEMEEAGWRWIQFGLGEGVKRLTLLSLLRPGWEARDAIPVPLFTPEFVAKQDLSRLEVLEFQGVSMIPGGTLDHVLSRCHSLQHLSLNNCSFHDEDTVIRICRPNNDSLQTLTFWCPEEEFHNVTRIEIVSAPGLRSLKVGGGPVVRRVEFGDDIPQLREFEYCRHIQFAADGDDPCYFPWSRSESNKFAPRLQFLKYDLTTDNFKPLSARAPEWLRFEKLTVLDLSIYIDFAGTSMLECTALLRAAPMLRQLFISFIHLCYYNKWEDPEQELPTWKHHSLQVLQLHGVHPSDWQVVDCRKPQMELAAYIIMASLSLKQVLIDTKNLRSTAPREPLQVDAHISEAKMELEARLSSHTTTSQIHFTYL